MKLNVCRSLFGVSHHLLGPMFDLIVVRIATKSSSAVYGPDYGITFNSIFLFFLKNERGKKRNCPKSGHPIEGQKNRNAFILLASLFEEKKYQGNQEMKKQGEKN